MSKAELAGAVGAECLEEEHGKLGFLFFFVAGSRAG